MRSYVRHEMLVWIGVLVLVFSMANKADAGPVTVTAVVSPNCGNNIIDSGEACDGSNLGGASCQSLGAGTGSLSCGSNCLFNTSSCSVPPIPPPSSGGGGGGAPAAPTTAVIFSGRAYPKSIITLLKDSTILATTLTGSDANFQISLSGLAGGNYLFSLYSQDDDGNHSPLANFPVLVTAGATVRVSGVFLAPTISVDKEEVRAGDTITFFGQSAPGHGIIISIHSDEEVLLETQADESGAYSYTYNTSRLTRGDHVAKSRADIGGEVSPYSRSAAFRVGSQNVAKKETKTTSDLNSDGRISLVDFSMLAYWYKRSTPPVRFDLNNDKKIDLVDFSIMAFYWTG